MRELNRKGRSTEGEKDDFLALRARKCVLFRPSILPPFLFIPLSRLPGPGRDGPFGPPPGQNPASGFPAPGSHLGSTESEALRWPGVMDAGRRKREAFLEGLELLPIPATALAAALQ